MNLLIFILMLVCVAANVYAGLVTWPGPWSGFNFAVAGWCAAFAVVSGLVWTQEGD